MGSACCRCVQPASVQPRKTYNTLVPQLFAGQPIKTDEPIDSTMRRKIQKLQEYLQANPAKIPKASRRLMRKIKATLRKPGDNLGHVKVAVHTYAYLLVRSTDDNSSYGPSFFLRELLTGPDPVVPLLLRDIHIEMRTLGAALLAVFTHVQSPLDSQLDAIQAHVPQVCRVAQGALRSERKEQKLQETTQRRRAGDKLAVPDPIYLIGRRDPVHVTALEVACLSCLQEVVSLCRKNKVVPAQIHDIQAVMLDNLQASRGSTGAFGSVDKADAAVVDQQLADAPAAAGTTAAAASTPGVVDTAFYAAMGMQQCVPHGSHPRELAEQLLQQMASFTQDIAMVDRVLDSFYDYMDDRDRWQEQGVVKNFLAALGASGGQHQYPIYASLLRHASSRRLTLPGCSAVLRVACDQGLQLSEAYSLSALHLALEELPHAWAEHAIQDPSAMQHFKQFLDKLKAGTAAMKDLAHLPTASEPSATAQGGSRGETPTAAGLTSGQQGPAPPATAAPAAEGPQQLAALRLTMLATVQALAARVQTAGELCEVVTAVMSAVGADLHYHESSSPRATYTAGGAPAANGPADGAAAAAAGAGAGAGAVPVGVSHPSGGRDAVAAGAVPDAVQLPTSLLTLELAAAAAEARMQQQVFTTPLSSFSGAGSFTAGDAALKLPAGVLPASLLSAALPLLQRAPPAVRHQLLRLLTALLPAASQGVANATQANQLTAAALSELQLARSQTAPHESAAQGDCTSAALVAGADALLRCCCRPNKMWPGAVLAVARALLQLQAQWVEQGYRSSGGGSPGRAHAVLLWFNSQLASLAAATSSHSLLALQLPLDPSGHPALQLTPIGLVAAASSTSAQADASVTVLQALERQRPPVAQHVEQLKAALCQVSVLADKHGEQLPALLDPRQQYRTSIGGSDSGELREKPQLDKQVNTLLGKRMNTLSRDLLHVGDLLKRDSMTRMHQLPSLSAVVDSGGSSAATQSPAAAAAASGAAGTTGAQMSRAGARAAAAVAVGGGVGTASADGAQTVSAQDVQLGLPVQSAQAAGSLSSSSKSLSNAVAAALQHPSTAGAYVVRDIQISKLAGELDAQL